MVQRGGIRKQVYEQQYGSIGQRSILKLMSEKYENGKANAVEYNEAKQNLMKAQSDELQAKYEYLFRTKILDFYKGEPIE